MSIIIQNISKKVHPTGNQQYVLRINNKVIAYFDHIRADGLSVCLRKAAIAADHPNRYEVQERQALLDACVEACARG